MSKGVGRVTTSHQYVWVVPIRWITLGATFGPLKIEQLNWERLELGPLDLFCSASIPDFRGHVEATHGHNAAELFSTAAVDQLHQKLRAVPWEGWGIGGVQH